MICRLATASKSIYPSLDVAKGSAFVDLMPDEAPATKNTQRIVKSLMCATTSGRTLKVLLDFKERMSLAAAHKLYDTDTTRLDFLAIERIAHRRVARVQSHF